MKEYERIEEINGFYKYYLYPDDEKQLFHIDKEGWVLYFDSFREMECLNVPEGVTSFMSGTLTTGHFKKLVLPQSIKRLPPSMFNYNKDLEEVIIPKECELKEIPYRCFALCRNLKKVELPASIKTIGECAFSMCQSLEEITIPEGCEIIKSCAFSNCRSLKNLVIPTSIQYIADDAFAGTSINIKHGE